MLPKPHRLRKSQEYDKVYQNGKKIYTPYFLLYYRPAKKQDLPKYAELPRIGIVASKKVGNAVARNRAKRMIREAVRELLPTLKPEFEAAIISFDKILETDSPTVKQTLESALEKADLIIK